MTAESVDGKDEKEKELEEEEVIGDMPASETAIEAGEEEMGMVEETVESNTSSKTVTAESMIERIYEE